MIIKTKKADRVNKKQREFGEVGTQTRAEATAKAWEEYNAQILHDETKEHKRLKRNR